MRRLTAAPPWLLAALLAALYLLLDPRTADLAAQEYRSGLWSRAGFTVWDNGWYSGHHVPAYSLLFPPLGAWLGPQVVGGPQRGRRHLGVRATGRERAPAGGRLDGAGDDDAARDGQADLRARGRAGAGGARRRAERDRAEREPRTDERPPFGR